MPGQPGPGRVSYSQAGEVMRATMARARAVGREDGEHPLSGFEWRALSLVLDRTVSWSRFSDRNYLGHLAAELYGVEVSSRSQRNKTAAAFRRLAAAGVIPRAGGGPGGPHDDRGPCYLLSVDPSGTGRMEDDTFASIEAQPFAPIEAHQSPGSGRSHSPRSGGPTEKGDREVISEERDREGSWWSRGDSDRQRPKKPRGAWAYGENLANTAGIDRHEAIEAIEAEFRVETDRLDALAGYDHQQQSAA